MKQKQRKKADLQTRIRILEMQCRRMRLQIDALRRSEAEANAELDDVIGRMHQTAIEMRETSRRELQMIAQHKGLL